MIRTDGNHTVIDGSNLEITLDFCSIVDSLLTCSPEIVVSLFKAYSPKLREEILKANANSLVISEAFITMHQKLKEKKQ